MAKRLGVEIPKNLGELIYSFRYRAALPSSITDKAPKGKEWIIRPVGRSKYQFVLVTKWVITPNPALSQIKVPDATPGMIVRYALNDEQALLAKLRYNRLIDILPASHATPFRAICARVSQASGKLKLTKSVSA